MSRFRGHIQELAKTDPTRAAVVCDQDVISYSELSVLVESQLKKMNGLGITWRHLVALDFAHPVALVVREIAAMEIGASVLPLLPSMNGATKAKILADVGKLGRHCLINASGAAMSTDPLSEGIYPYSLLHFTSGSMGAQKIVVRPPKNIVDEAIAVALELEFMKRHNVLVTTPLAHSFGCGLWRAIVYAGGTLFTSQHQSLSARLTSFKSMIAKGVDYMFGVPYLYNQLLRHEPMPTPGTEMRCFAGGEPLPQALAAKWLAFTGVPLQQEYGLGEGGITTLAAADSPSDSIGRPIAGVLITVENDSGGISLENGVEGQLIVYRPWAPNRYLLEGASDTFRADGGIATGDIGVQIGEDFYLRGRLKDIISVAGLKVTAFEIEEALRKHPLVTDAVAVSTVDNLRGERLVAIVSATDKVEERDLQAMLRMKLESYKVPQRIVVIGGELPRTDSGKVDRNAIKFLSHYA